MYDLPPGPAALDSLHVPILEKTLLVNNYGVH